MMVCLCSLGRLLRFGDDSRVMGVDILVVGGRLRCLRRCVWACLVSCVSLVLCGVVIICLVSVNVLVFWFRCFSIWICRCCEFIVWVLWYSASVDFSLLVRFRCCVNCSSRCWRWWRRDGRAPWD